MANILKFGQSIKLSNLAADPSSPENGQLYYNTVSNVIRQYVNGGWANIAAGSVSLTGQALNQYEVIVGNGSNLSAAVNSNSVGDILVDSTGGLTIKSGVIVDADINASAAIAQSKLAALTASKVAVTDASGFLAAGAYAPGDVILKGGSVAFTADQSHGGFKITSLADGTLSTDAATKGQMDTADGLKVSKSGDTMSGALAMGANKITGLAAGTASGDAVRYEQAILASGVNAFAAAQSMGGFKLTNLADGTASSDAINKGQLDAALLGLKPKAAARAATTADIVIATALNVGDVIDGVTLADGDRVLVKDQAAPAENGIYIAGASPARSTDFDSVSPIDEINGAMVAIEEGTANAGKLFVQSGAAVATVGTDPISFVFFSSAATLVGGDGITISGSNVSVDHDGEGLTFATAQLALELDGSTLSKSATGLKVASGGITNTEVNASAAIARSKLASGTAYRLAANDVSGVLSDAAAITAARALISDANGIPTHSAVTSTELGYVSGVTSAIQTQLGTKASQALDNLAAVAINTSLISDTNNTDDLGSDAIEWKDVYAHSIKHDDASNPNLNVQTLGNNGSLIATAHGTGNLDVKATKLRRSENGASSNFLEEQYLDAIALADASTDVVISSLSFAHASFEGQEVVYKIKEATSNRVRIGTLSIVTNGTDISVVDTFNDTADVGISFSAVVNGASIDVRFTSTSTGNARTMRADVKRIRA